MRRASRQGRECVLSRAIERRTEVIVLCRISFLASLLCSMGSSLHAQRIHLNAPLERVVVGKVLEQHVSEDGRFLVYAADPADTGLARLHRTAPDGTGPALDLGVSIRLGDPGALEPGLFQLSADGGRVVFRSPIEGNSLRFELHGIPSDGSAAPVLLSAPLVEGGGVTGFRVSADGRWVVYRADQQAVGRFELHAVPITGGRAVRVNGPLFEHGDVQEDFVIGPDSRSVFFRANPGSSAAMDLFRGSVSGRQPPARLHRPDLGVAERLFLAPDGARVLYTKGEVLATRGPLFSAPIDGLLEAVALAPDVDPLSFQGFGANGMRAVFGLTSFRVDGSDVPLLLDPGAYEDVVGSSLGKDLFYRASRVTSSLGPYLRTDLFRVPIDGSAVPAQINRPFPLGPIGEEVIEFDVASRARRAAYRTTSGKVFGVDLDGLSPPRLLAVAEPSSSTLLVSPDGRRVVFRSGLELVSAALDGDPAPTVLGPGLLGLAITPDSRRVVYWVLEGIANVLHSAPLDGSAAPERLDEPSRSSFDVQTTPDSSRVVFQAFLGGATNRLSMPRPRAREIASAAAMCSSSVPPVTPCSRSSWT
jgi:hypothetical protein